MNSNSNFCDCGSQVPMPMETLPAIAGTTAEILMDTENVLERLSQIIECKVRANTPNDSEKKVDCFRESLLDIRASAERVNGLARMLLDSFQS